MNVLPATQAGAANIATPRLATAAKQFESVLLGQWLQEAESSFASVPGGDSDTDSGGQQMQSFATQQLATSLTASGGIGIAKLVQGALLRASERENAGTASGAPVAASSAREVGTVMGKASSAASVLAAYTAGAKR